MDDEPRLLSALRRRLSNRFAVETACSASETLSKLETIGGIAVIAADMRMREANDITLLERVQACWPNVRRIMLTADTDQETAIATVNNGKIFRFVVKQVDADALDAAIAEYRFITGSEPDLQRLKRLAGRDHNLR